jgi:hypothetical protein
VTLVWRFFAYSKSVIEKALAGLREAVARYFPGNRRSVMDITSISSRCA